MSVFKKAEKKQVKLKIALSGPSGSGKTFSALALAKGLGEKIALIDTENESASLFSDRFSFDTLALEPPYTIPKYLHAIQAAEQAGYNVLVIDSITHAWAGDGGLLAKKEAMDTRGGNSFANWGSITKEQEAFKAALLNADIHLVVTMRSKQDYVLEVNEKGKSTPRKVGLAPIQREGMEYEFTTVFDIAMDHNAKVSKDRTGIFDERIFKIDSSTGHEFLSWLKDAKPVDAKPNVVTPESEKPVDNKPAEPPTVTQKHTEKKPLSCLVCEAPMVVNSTNVGYVCSSKTKGHSMVIFSELDSFKNKSASVISAGDRSL